MKHKMTLGPCEVCPDCDGHKRVVCSCVPRNVDDVAEMVGAVGCPECDGDGDHWCPTCMGTGSVPRKFACTCDENCDEPCRACNRPTVQAARTAYRMGRKDARRYAARSVGEAHVDSQTVGRIAALIWTATRCATLPSQYDDLCDREQTKLRMVAQAALSSVGTALLRALDEAPDEPAHIESIARAAEMSIRCGKCKNCLDLEKVKSRVLACANPPFSHADDGVVQVWNQELARLPCTKGQDGHR